METNSPEAVTKARCQGVDCEKVAGTLQCPTCLTMGEDSFFCSQECFKRNWVRPPVSSSWRLQINIVANQVPVSGPAQNRPQVGQRQSQDEKR